MHRVGQFIDGLDEDAVLGDRLGDADDIRLLKRIGADEAPRHLAGYRYDRHRIHVGCRQPGDQIGRAGAAGGDTHANLSGCAGVAVGGVRGGLFVAHQDMPQRRRG